MSDLLKVRADSLVVSEIFGPTFQGEGRSIGRRAAFLRLGLCNLTCTWCDTPYTWDWKHHDPQDELRRRDLASVAREIRELRVDLLVVSGGEPLLQQRALAGLFAMLDGMEIEIETNGTVRPSAAITELVERFTVSPKLANSAVREGKRINATALEAFAGNGKSVFKFVASGPTDLIEIRRLVDRFELGPVYVMPEGTNADRVVEGMRRLAGEVLANGWNLTPRLHVLLWDDRRAV